jgi:maltose-binding protein MalE
MDPAQQRVLHTQLDRFMAQHPGIRVETNHFKTEVLRTQYQTAALAGSGPDLVYGPGDQIGPFSIMGLIVPLETVVSPDTLALFSPASLATLGGHVYALADQVGNHLTLVYNRKFVGHPALDTDAWLAQLDSLTVDLDGDGKTDRYGVVMNLSEPFWLIPWLGGFGGWVMDESGNPTLDTQAMSEAMRFMRELVRRKVIPESCDYPLADTLFKQGKAAYSINGPWSWQSYRDAGIDIGLACIPRVSATGLWPRPMTSPLGYSMNVNVPELRKDSVLALLSFLTAAAQVGEVSRELGALPSREDVAAWPMIVKDPILRASWSQLEKGRPMPVVPQMRIIWDVIRPAYQQVLSGGMRAEQAGPWMQREALQKIKEMRE